MRYSLAIVALALAAACVSYPVDGLGNYIALGPRVQQHYVTAARAELEECIGRPLPRLDHVKVYYAGEEILSCRGNLGFDCLLLHPEFADDAGECPALCAGISGIAHSEIVVTSTRAALKHELIHVGVPLHDHNPADAEWGCQ